MTTITAPFPGDSSLYRRRSSYRQSEQLSETSFVFAQPAVQPEATPLDTELIYQYHQALSDVESLARLPDNWDGHGAQSVDDIAQEAAARMLSALLMSGIPKPDILPTSNGGVAFEWESQEINLSLEIEAYKDVRACVWSSTADEQEGPLTKLTDAVARALWLIGSRI